MSDSGKSVIKTGKFEVLGLSESEPANVETPGWCLHQGEGERSYIKRIEFDPILDEVPEVVVGINHFDGGGRLVVSAKNVTKQGFDLKFATYGKTRIASAIASFVLLRRV